jgi:hypothetical protein
MGRGLMVGGVVRGEGRGVVVEFAKGKSERGC